MGTLLIVLLAMVAPYPVAGIAFGVVLGMTFYVAAIVAFVSRSARA